MVAKLGMRGRFNLAEVVVLKLLIKVWKHPKPKALMNG